MRRVPSQSTQQTHSHEHAQRERERGKKHTTNTPTQKSGHKRRVREKETRRLTETAGEMNTPVNPTLIIPPEMVFDPNQKHQNTTCRIPLNLMCILVHFLLRCVSVKGIHRSFGLLLEEVQTLFLAEDPLLPTPIKMEPDRSLKREMLRLPLVLLAQDQEQPVPFFQESWIMAGPSEILPGILVILLTHPAEIRQVDWYRQNPDQWMPESSKGTRGKIDP